MKEIETRLDTYCNFVRDGTPDSMAKAVAARKQIEEWAVSDISFLLTECKRLQHDIRIYKKHFDEHAAEHSCNDCGIQKRCFIAPEWGDIVRHNCAFWEEVQAKTLENDTKQANMLERKTLRNPLALAMGSRSASGIADN